jgi:hypothetical protein
MLIDIHEDVESLRLLVRLSPEARGLWPAIGAVVAHSSPGQAFISSLGNGAESGS